MSTFIWLLNGKIINGGMVSERCSCDNDASTINTSWLLRSPSFYPSANANVGAGKLRITKASRAKCEQQCMALYTHTLSTIWYYIRLSERNIFVRFRASMCVARLLRMSTATTTTMSKQILNVILFKVKIQHKLNLIRRQNKKQSHKHLTVPHNM